MINSISTSSETDKSKCISCMRCVSICPVHARKISQLMTSVAADESVMVDMSKVNAIAFAPYHHGRYDESKSAGNWRSFYSIVVYNEISHTSNYIGTDHCLKFFLPIDCCHSLAIFWEEERFFPWLQCCLYFHAFCIYQMVSALRKKEKVLWHMMPNTDMKQAALLNPYGIGNAGTGYQNPAPALLIVLILLWYNHKLSTPPIGSCIITYLYLFLKK